MPVSSTVLGSPSGDVIAAVVPELVRAENPFMQIALDEARAGMRAGHGGPFGSAVVRGGELIASGHNRVLSSHDPTRHGEVDAIRAAAAKLGTHDLSGCDLYTTGEPCPMCLAACLWANIRTVYYGCTIADNESIGFRDAKFDELMGGRARLGSYLIPMDRPACLALFREYSMLSAQRY